jgi:hypothetical protein
MLGGTLAWMLSSGGAYHAFKRGGAEAKRIGDQAAQEMLGGSYDGAMVVESSRAWSEFFCDIAWDYTGMVIDSKRRIIHVLLATDTD